VKGSVLIDDQDSIVGTQQMVVKGSVLIDDQDSVVGTPTLTPTTTPTLTIKNLPHPILRPPRTGHARIRPVGDGW